ncbi:hypothetical protein HOD61_01050 [archaeon]|jgi:hypothetical protein|nr:hypothetical protein [archaeon]
MNYTEEMKAQIKEVYSNISETSKKYEKHFLEMPTYLNGAGNRIKDLISGEEINDNLEGKLL